MQATQQIVRLWGIHFQRPCLLGYQSGKTTVLCPSLRQMTHWNSSGLGIEVEGMPGGRLILWFPCLPMFLRGLVARRDLKTENWQICGCFPPDLPYFGMPSGLPWATSDSGGKVLDETSRTGFFLWDIRTSHFLHCVVSCFLAIEELSYTSLQFIIRCHVHCHAELSIPCWWEGWDFGRAVGNCKGSFSYTYNMGCSCSIQPATRAQR